MAWQTTVILQATNQSVNRLTRYESGTVQGSYTDASGEEKTWTLSYKIRFTTTETTTESVCDGVAKTTAQNWVANTPQETIQQGEVDIYGSKKVTFDSYRNTEERTIAKSNDAGGWRCTCRITTISTYAYKQQP